MNGIARRGADTFVNVPMRERTAIRNHFRPAPVVFLPVAAALMVLAVPAAGQLTGVVTDTADAPIEGVVVEAWTPAERLAARVTGADGRFDFAEAIAAQTTVLRAGRLGYRHLTRAVEGAGDYRLRMVEEPVAIEGLVVESERRSCELEDEGEARLLWNRLRKKYAGPMDTVGIATYLASRERLVGLDEIGPLDVPGEMLEQRGSSSQLRFSWTRQIRRNGYAFPVRRTDRGRSFDSWSYPPLEADFAPHFVDRAFGELHRFRIRDRGAFGWIIGFCPRNTDDPSIRGTMRIAPDTTLISLEWRFQTPEPDESAGGRAFFSPVSGPTESNWPLPNESLFWRRLPTGEFQEVHRRFEGWRVAQGDTVPFLPPRGGRPR